MNTKNYLIVLTETERSMIEEALTQSISNPFHYINFSQKKREQFKKESHSVLDMVKGLHGGFRKVISDYNLHLICEALWWYASFIPANKKYINNMNEYHRLSTTLKYRNQNKELFDFDPQNYNPKEYKKINTQDFSKERFLLARRNDGQINYISEIIQEKDETDINYKLRAESLLKNHRETNTTGEWLLMTNRDFEQYKYSKEVSYFSQK